MEPTKNKKLLEGGDCEEWMIEYDKWYRKYLETGGNPGSPPPPPPGTPPA